MRFVIINLFFICLLLFGIGYLAFGDVGTVVTSETCPQPICQLFDFLKIMQPFDV